jgi:hypothetical protein
MLFVGYAISVPETIFAASNAPAFGGGAPTKRGTSDIIAAIAVKKFRMTASSRPDGVHLLEI